MKISTRNMIKQVRFNWVLYLFILPAFAYIVIFSYIPMYGVQVAFRDYTVSRGILGSKWVALKWFYTFFSSPRSMEIIFNTLRISFYGLIAGFPFPIIFALLLNQVKTVRFKKAVQTVTYMPHFISIVVITGMISAFLSPSTGFLNNILTQITGREIYYLGTPKYYIHIYVWSGIWQGFGWGSIIYMAALSSVDPELHEAAIIDGAGRLQRIWHIDIPSIMPVMVILLVLRAGDIMTVGFEKSWLLQNTLNRGVSEVISTYSYEIGIIRQMFSYSSAIGLFNNSVNFLILIIVNYAAKKLNETSLW